MIEVLEWFRAHPNEFWWLVFALWLVVRAVRQ